MKVHKLPAPRPREAPEEYARRRANETRAAYLVTRNGCAFVASAFNRRSALSECGGIAAVYKPERKAGTRV